MKKSANYKKKITDTEKNELPVISSYTIVKTAQDGKNTYQVLEIVTHEDFVVDVVPLTEKLASRPDVTNFFQNILKQKVIRPIIEG